MDATGVRRFHLQRPVGQWRALQPLTHSPPSSSVVLRRSFFSLDGNEKSDFKARELKVTAVALPHVPLPLRLLLPSLRYSSASSGPLTHSLLLALFPCCVSECAHLLPRQSPASGAQGLPREPSQLTSPGVHPSRSTCSASP